MSALRHDLATTASRAQGLEIIAPPDSWISGPSRIFGLNSLDETECGLTGLNLNVGSGLNPPRGKPRGIFTVRIKNRFLVRSLTPPKAARNAFAIAVQGRWQPRKKQGFNL